MAQRDHLTPSFYLKQEKDEGGGGNWTENLERSLFGLIIRSTPLGQEGGKERRRRKGRDNEKRIEHRFLKKYYK